MTPSTSLNPATLLPSHRVHTVAAPGTSLKQQAQAAGKVLWAVTLGGLAVWAWMYTSVLP